MNKRNWFRQPLTYFWIFSNFLFLFLDKRGIFESAGMDGTVIIVGNFIIFLVFIVSYLLTNRSFKSVNAQSFVRAIYLGFIIKFFVIALAAFIYIMVSREQVNKNALFVCMGLYVIYAILEVGKLTRTLKVKKNV